MITSSSPGTGMWLSVAVLAKLAAYFGDHRPMTIDRVSGEATTTATTSSAPLQARLLHRGRVVALVRDEQLAAALIALLDAVPRSLGAFADTYVDLLRQHSADATSGDCRECGQPAPCGTRTLLQERIGALSVPTQARRDTDRP
ncbi:hypothetical protein JNUCC0626_49560 (plasmid) [Lentzea sp. JNUCC 0626]|uniref:hypothetical protein n=1 Tax=Lentzea sp. JNUCC 0626 TaxID=3367513 RepID=UPI00374A340D